MKKAEVVVGASYEARLHGTFTTVRVDRVCPHGGWYATNRRTGRQVRIRGAAKLRRRVEDTPEPPSRQMELGE